MAALRTLIVDDEPLAIERLQIMCAELEKLALVGTASDGEAALRLVDALHPELVFLDISMPGLTGLDVARRIGAAGGAAPAIVFVTAHDHFAVAAFDTEAVDYLLKPVSHERLKKAVARVLGRRSAASDTGSAINGAAGHVREFWVPNRGELVRVAASDIERVEAERDYMRLVCGARSWLIHETISALEARLDPAMFIRLHRSTIVRRDRIVKLSHDGQGNWSAELACGHIARIGRTYLASVRAGIMHDSHSAA
jgi:two-component system response regulator AlgR